MVARTFGIYYDTDSYRLIRRSIENPAYKEKLRIRSYAQATPESPVFVELKKKYQSYAVKEKEMIDMLRCRNGNLEITVSRQETVIAEL